MEEATVTRGGSMDAIRPRVVRAWSELRPEAPREVERVAEGSSGAIYRLRGVEADGTSVIAKRSPKPSAAIERLVHEEILSALPLRSLRWYGAVDEPDSSFGWLFLEEPVGEEYSPLKSHHRELAAAWLGTIHAARVPDAPAAHLPDRSTPHYRGILQATHQRLLAHLENCFLDGEDLALLARLASHCTVLERHWDDLDDICDDVPPTLVHGDLVAPKVRIAEGPDGEALLAFDWERAGWGTPAIDLAQFTGGTLSPDLAVYRTTLARSGEAHEFRDVWALAECGRFLRLIEAMHWACACLVFDRPRRQLVKPMSMLRGNEIRLTEALQRARWLP